MVAALEAGMVKGMRIQVQQSSQEGINTNPPTLGGTDVVKKSFQPHTHTGTHKIPVAKLIACSKTQALCSLGEVQFSGSIFLCADWTWRGLRFPDVHTHTRTRKSINMSGDPSFSLSVPAEMLLSP